MKKVFFWIIIFMFPLALLGCEEEGPAESAGEEIDESVEEMQEQTEEAGEEIQEGMEEEN